MKQRKKRGCNQAEIEKPQAVELRASEVLAPLVHDGDSIPYWKASVGKGIWNMAYVINHKCKYCFTMPPIPSWSIGAVRRLAAGISW